MKHRKLGNTDLTVPVICLGTMTWGLQNTEAQAHEQLDYAVAHGINFIDTAEVYPVPPDPSVQGRTESYIGSWLKKRGKRDDLIIASKVASTRQSASFATRTVTALDRANIRAAIQGSLARLGIDYLDLYQVHAPARPANIWGQRGIESLPETDGTPIEETLAALSELVKEGLVRHIGVSNETPWGVMQWLKLSDEQPQLARIVSIQNQYSLTNRTYELGMSEISLREHVGLLAYSPLSGGVLSGKYIGGTMPKGARLTLSSRNSRYNAPQVQPAIEAYLAVARKHGLDPSAMALAFAVSRPFMTSVIIGATTMEQLATNIAAGDLTLQPEVLSEIAAVYHEHPDPTF